MASRSKVKRENSLSVSHGSAGKAKAEKENLPSISGSFEASREQKSYPVDSSAIGEHASHDSPSLGLSFKRHGSAASASPKPLAGRHSSVFKSPTGSKSRSMTPLARPSTSPRHVWQDKNSPSRDSSLAPERSVELMRVIQELESEKRSREILAKFNVDLSQQVEDMYSRTDDMAAQIAEFNARVEELETVCTRRDEDVESLSTQLAEAEEIVSNLEGALKEKEASEAVLRARVSDYEHRMEELVAVQHGQRVQVVVQGLEAEIVQLREEAAEATSLRARLSHVEARAAEAEARAAQYEDEASGAKHRMEEAAKWCQGQLADVQQELVSLRTTTEDAHHKAEEERARRITAETEREGLESQVLILHERSVNDATTLRHLREEKERLEAALAKATQEVAEAAASDKAKPEFSKAVDDLDFERKRAQRLLEENNRLTARLKSEKNKFEAEMAQEAEKVKPLEAGNARLEKMLAETKDRLTEQLNTERRSTKRLTGTVKTLRDKIKETEDAYAQAMLEAKEAKDKLLAYEREMRVRAAAGETNVVVVPPESVAVTVAPPVQKVEKTDKPEKAEKHAPTTLAVPTGKGRRSFGGTPVRTPVRKTVRSAIAKTLEAKKAAAVPAGPFHDILVEMAGIEHVLAATLKTRSLVKATEVINMAHARLADVRARLTEMSNGKALVVDVAPSISDVERKLKHLKDRKSTLQHQLQTLVESSPVRPSQETVVVDEASEVLDLDPVPGPVGADEGAEIPTEAEVVVEETPAAPQEAEAAVETVEETEVESSVPVPVVVPPTPEAPVAPAAQPVVSSTPASHRKQKGAAKKAASKPVTLVQGSVPCKVCESPVYQNDRQISFKGEMFHKKCFRCTDCNASLSEYATSRMCKNCSLRKKAAPVAAVPATPASPASAPVEEETTPATN